MVHNGIEYGDMQLISEAYDVLKTVGGLTNEELVEAFNEWNSVSAAFQKVWCPQAWGLLNFCGICCTPIHKACDVKWCWKANVRRFTAPFFMCKTPLVPDGALQEGRIDPILHIHTVDQRNG